MLPFTRSWELRRLEDVDNGGDEDENTDDDSSDDTLMAIENEVESALIDMFYSAPSEWTGRHWAIFASMIALISLFLCWFCLCVIPCFCCSKGESKPLIVRTEDEQYNQYKNNLRTEDEQSNQYKNNLLKDNQNNHEYTNELMIDNNATEGEETDENSFGQLEYATSTYTATDTSNFDSGASTGEESFQNEYTRANNHGDYYRYTGPNRRQLT